MAGHPAVRGVLCERARLEQDNLCWRFSRVVGFRFEGVSWEPRRAAPILAGAIAWIDCSIEAIHEMGDHWFVLGPGERTRPRRGLRRAPAPLLPRFAQPLPAARLTWARPPPSWSASSSCCRKRRSLFAPAWPAQAAELRRHAGRCQSCRGSRSCSARSSLPASAGPRRRGWPGAAHRVHGARRGPPRPGPSPSVRLLRAALVTLRRCGNDRAQRGADRACRGSGRRLSPGSGQLADKEGGARLVRASRRSGRTGLRAGDDLQCGTRSAPRRSPSPAGQPPHFAGSW